MKKVILFLSLLLFSITFAGDISANSQSIRTVTNIEVYTVGEDSNPTVENKSYTDCYLCDRGYWRLAGGGSYTEESCKRAGYSTDSHIPDSCKNDQKCYVCDAGKWRLESGDGRCHDNNPPTCEVDNRDTYGGCLGGGAATGDVCETNYNQQSGINGIIQLKKGVAGLSVVKDANGLYISSENNNQNALVVKPCTVDSSNSKIDDQFLNLVIRKISKDGRVDPIVFETKLPNCDSKNIPLSDLGNLNEVTRLDITAAFLPDEKSEFGSSSKNLTLALNQVNAQNISNPEYSTKIYSFPKNISTSDKNITITATTNYPVSKPVFTVTNRNQTSNLAIPNQDLSVDCQSGSGNCIYRMLIASPFAHYQIKFCDDNNQCDSLEFDGPASAVSNTIPDNTVSNNQPAIPLVDNSDLDHISLALLDELSMPLNGDKLTVDLSPRFSDPNILDVVGFFKVYYKNDQYPDIVPIKFSKKRISSEEDGISGCCEKDPKNYNQGCRQGENCSSSNGACESGFACQSN